VNRHLTGNYNLEEIMNNSSFEKNKPFVNTGIYVLVR